MTYSEYRARTGFSRLDLLAHANGTLIEEPHPEMGMLPAPPLLMFDRIVDIQHRDTRGSMVAEQDVDLGAWYFWCHFRHDPVQPGCLGVDAVWQLLGFYLTLRGAEGTGRALGCGRVEFSGQIRPHNRVVRYEVEVKRCSALSSGAVAIGDARVLVDGKPIYTVANAKAGAFRGIRYPDYPQPSENSREGGKQ
ncbi:MAG TPA: bifunctional 3-hydroxydecanoyl-ACP dehydratase/trans-2-decenoyl-ACP isomerase [Bryobacteraceae bacterium]|nr:bifunctional 3-hydroxydecanoyl-ACP dehydratase/trans-2-decenoyl-ACP isomerase [Bryobacteraceae bacterium]